MSTLDLVRGVFAADLLELIGSLEGSRTAPPPHEPWILTKRGRADLCRLWALGGFTTGAEVGVWTGQFSEQICRFIPNVRLYCVDPWESYDAYRDRKNDPDRLLRAYDDAKARLAPFNCRLMRMTSIDAARTIQDGSLDFVYIDGNHGREYVLADLEAWSPKVRSGGIVAGHDFQTSRDRPWIQVESAVRAFTHAHDITPWFVLASDKSPSYCWVVK